LLSPKTIILQRFSVLADFPLSLLIKDFLAGIREICRSSLFIFSTRHSITKSRPAFSHCENASSLYPDHPSRARPDHHPDAGLPCGTVGNRVPWQTHPLQTAAAEPLSQRRFTQHHRGDRRGAYTGVKAQTLHLSFEILCVSTSGPPARLRFPALDRCDTRCCIRRVTAEENRKGRPRWRNHSTMVALPAHHTATTPKALESVPTSTSTYHADRSGPRCAPTLQNPFPMGIIYHQ